MKKLYVYLIYNIFLAIAIIVLAVLVITQFAVAPTEQKPHPMLIPAPELSEVLNYASVASVLSMRNDNILIMDSPYDYFTISKVSGGYIISLHGDYTLKSIGDNKYEIRIGE